jgi:lipoate-protein ligase A
MNRIYESSVFDPYVNIALEKQLAEELTDDIILFLWQNDQTVVIGRNQNPYQECNLDYMKQHNIKLARRYSGGGAVFHDLGNINYTLIMKEALFDLEKVKGFLTEMTHDLGIECEFTGKNDLTVNGLKFSGHAYFVENEIQVIHGTIMVNLQLEQLAKTLTPSMKKLQSKGIESIKSRVINLQQVNPEITIETVKKAFCNAFLKEYGIHENKIYLDKTDVDEQKVNELKSHNWLYEQTPTFSIVLEKRYPYGMISLNLEVVDNSVQKARIYSDSLKTDWSTMEKSLIGQTFQPENLWTLFESRYLTLNDDKQG